MVTVVSGQSIGPISRVKLSLKVGQIICPETSVTKYQSKLRNQPEERNLQLHHDGSLKSRRLFADVSRYELKSVLVEFVGYWAFDLGLVARSI
jgi:hypothetical protein